MTPDDIPKRPVRGRLGIALAALLLPALPATAQTLVNPDFETDSFSGTVFDNAPITGWTTTTPALVGLNAHADNGSVPDGGAGLAFLTAGGVLKTTVSGLTVGTRYNVSFRTNAASEGSATIGQGQPYLSFSTNASANPLDTTVGRVAAVGGGAPYRFAAYEFTATATSQELTIANTRTSGTHILLIDSLAVVPSNNSWVVAPWTGDADSGIDASYAYTHAINFNLANGLTVNGVPFMGATTAIMETAVAGRINVGPLGGSTTLVPQLTGDSLNLGKNLRGGNLTFALENLKPNTQYVATFFIVGMDDPGSIDEFHSATYNSFENSQMLTVDQNRYGKLKGLTVRETYTTDSSGTATLNNAPLGSSHRLAAFTNREAVAFSGTSGWSSVQWTNDASSGINSTYHYTHAYKFNSATSPVVNGVTFKGLTGDNPVDGSVFSTSRLTGSATNPGTNISGASASLATTYHGTVATGSPSSYILTGLSPGKEYICTLYSVGSADIRPVCFYGTASGKPAVIDQKLYGTGNGIRMEYRYFAPPSGVVAMSSSAYDSTKPFQVYALSNREAQVTAGPGITSAPAAATIPAGENYTLQVSATGTAPLTYQWYFNNALIPGATAATYTLVTPDYDDSGDYKVKVTNPGGNVTTDPAAITVADGIPGLFSTGTGWDGQLLGNGAPGVVVKDPHYLLWANLDNSSHDSFVVSSNRPAAWLENDAHSQWIGPRSNALGAASSETNSYVYRIPFTLTNFDANSVVISGRWACDDYQVGIYVNGTYVGFSGVTFGYSTLMPFQIDAALLSSRGVAFRVDGTPNTLDFVVRNENLASTGTANGLIVRDLKGIGSLVTLTEPEVITDPVSTTAGIGETVTLGVVAGGSPLLTYQWQKDTVNIPGATHSYLTIPITGTGDAGAYRVVVTNSIGSDTSAAATLTVITGAIPPSNFTLTVSGGTATGSFHGTPGASYTVERSTTLAPGSWVTVQTSTAPASGIVDVVDASAPAVRAFYRIGYAP